MVSTTIFDVHCRIQRGINHPTPKKYRFYLPSHLNRALPIALETLVDLLQLLLAYSLYSVLSLL